MREVEIILYFHMGAYPHADIMRMMERSGRDVMPALAAEASTPG